MKTISWYLWTLERKICYWKTCKNCKNATEKDEKKYCSKWKGFRVINHQKCFMWEKKEENEGVHTSKVAK